MLTVETGEEGWTAGFCGELTGLCYGYVFAREVEGDGLDLNLKYKTENILKHIYFFVVQKSSSKVKSLKFIVLLSILVILGILVVILLIVFLL